LILSIESSCDDSSIAIIEIASKKVLFHKKISQDIEHSKYGGVVPELASRLHAIALPKILEDTKEFFPNLKAVAVTNEPGLNVTLLEGIMMAKALHLSLNIPLIAINHLKAHIYSLFIEKESNFPLTVLLVSGGHTMIIECKHSDDFQIKASTLDDSFGESFDKVSKMLGLSYPGGPIIESLAKVGEDIFNFPLPLKNNREIAFSFSGLKNSVRLEIEKIVNLDYQAKANIAKSFQKVAIEHLIFQCKRYFKQSNIKEFAIVGGASANLALREAFLILCDEFNINLNLAPIEFCSDNAVMVGRCAIDSFLQNRFSAEIEAKSRINSFN